MSSPSKHRNSPTFHANSKRRRTHTMYLSDENDESFQSLLMSSCAPSVPQHHSKHDKTPSRSMTQSPGIISMTVVPPAATVPQEDDVDVIVISDSEEDVTRAASVNVPTSVHEEADHKGPTDGDRMQVKEESISTADPASQIDDICEVKDHPHDTHIFYSGQLKNGKRHGYGESREPEGTYTGAWQDDMKHGFGQFEYVGSSSYVGDWANNLMHGEGTASYSNGDEYAGSWKDGRKHGHGEYHFSNGDVYVGQWRDDLLNGKGTLTYANGSRYKGMWVDDKRSGFGELCYPPGGFDVDYKGDFWDNQRQGRGVSTSLDGSVYEGDWHADQRQGEGQMRYADGGVYTGSFVANLRSGRGSMSFPDGRMYDGAWLDDQITGHGEMHYPDLTKYDGDWLDGRRHGNGQQSYVSGDLYSGQWSDDTIHGSGVFQYADSSRYAGLYVQGKREGSGDFLDVKGNRFRGQWVDDKLHGPATITSANGGVFSVEYRNGVLHGPARFHSGQDDGDSFAGKFVEDKFHYDFPDSDDKLVMQFDGTVPTGDALFTSGITSGSVMLAWIARGPRRLDGFAATRVTALEILSRDALQCVVCFDEDMRRVQGLCCARQHFICDVCFNQHVKTIATREERLSIGAAVLCPWPKCDCEAFDQKLIAMHTKSDTFEQLTVLRMAIKEQEIIREMEARNREELERELARREQMTAFQREVEAGAKFVTEEIFTLKCPTCKAAFVDFSGCFALTCRSCPAQFCGWCLKACADGNAAHACAARCGAGRQDVNNLYYADHDVFNKHHNQRRLRDVVSFLKDLSESKRQAVIALIEKPAKQLGLTIPTDFSPAAVAPILAMQKATSTAPEVPARAALNGAAARAQQRLAARRQQVVGGGEARHERLQRMRQLLRAREQMGGMDNGAFWGVLDPQNMGWVFPGHM